MIISSYQVWEERSRAAAAQIVCGIGSLIGPESAISTSSRVPCGYRDEQPRQVVGVVEDDAAGETSTCNKLPLICEAAQRKLF
jgi:hypothetical protein